MKVWTDKQGNKLTASEFMTRWKQGMNQVSQLQQIKAQINFTYLTMIGIMCGIVVTAYKFNSLWWLCIILVAAFGNTGVGLLGLKQKKNLFVGLDRLSSTIKDKEVSHEEQERIL